VIDARDDGNLPGDRATDALADGVERRLDPRYVPMQRIVGRIVTASLSFGALIALLLCVALGVVPGWIGGALAVAWLAGTVALAWFAERWPAVEYRHISYMLDSNGVEIRTGVFWRKVITVPRPRVQHTDVSQGPLQRRYGLGTLSVYTAGSEYARVDLPGLDHPTALAIRDQLLPSETGDAV
jgi:membrane protein YdbS with pleckstrin-like domain